jgi:hypothetical protein
MIKYVNSFEKVGEKKGDGGVSFIFDLRIRSMKFKHGAHHLKTFF